jgi:hypothetical protein
MLKPSRGRKIPDPNRKAARTPGKAVADPPSLWEILGRFDQALSLVTVCHQSLAAKEAADVGDEEEVLRQGISMLKDVHRELDQGAMLVTAHSTSKHSSKGAR